MAQRRWCVAWARWKETRKLKHQVKVAKLKAEEALAAYYIKSRIEWDMKWTGDALDRTHKDEFLILLWSLPTIGLFIPGMRDLIAPGFEALKQISESAPSIFLYGWTTIFAATFGVRVWHRHRYPEQAAHLMQSMSGIPDDVPDDAAKSAQELVNTRSTLLDGDGIGPRVY